MCVFGCGIVKFNEKQIKELKKNYEISMIRKLGLGDKFPRKLLHMQKKRLGVRLIEPNTVIDVLVLRLHVGNKTLQGAVSKTLEVHEENSFIDSGLTKEGRKVNSARRRWKEG